MKVLINVFLLLSLLTMKVVAQDTGTPSVFKTDIATYLTAMNQEQWDTVIDMMYPKFFTLGSKEQLRQSFAQVTEMGMKVTTQLNAVEKISPVVLTSNEQFHKIDYRATVKVKMSGIMLENKEQMKKQLQSIYGAKQVKYNAPKHEFIIANAKKSMLAIAPTYSNIWKYLDLNAQQEQVLLRIISKEVLLQLH